MTNSVPDRDIRPPSHAAYSTSQMDNFYEAMASGMVKPSGVMNYIQHLFIAQQCSPGARVLDLCCGRGLLVPLLRRYAPLVASYCGLDISRANLSEARRFLGLDRQGPFPFEVSLVEHDVARPFEKEMLGLSQVIVYTSSIEHLDKEAGIASLQNARRVVAPGGTLYLSTPRTAGSPPRSKQYSVHVYEWDREELEDALLASGWKVSDCVGLLPPESDLLMSVIAQRFGHRASKWYEEMRLRVPNPFLAPVMAAVFPEVARELMFICHPMEPPR